MIKVYRSMNDLLFHTFDEEKTLENLNSSSEGITGEEAAKRITIYGKNELIEGKKKTILQMFIEQFKNIMVIILLIAAVISGLTHELTDSFIILAVVIINAVLGVVQENKAEKALSALKKMSSPYAKVKRNGKVTMVITAGNPSGMAATARLIAVRNISRYSLP